MIQPLGFRVALDEEFEERERGILLRRVRNFRSVPSSESKALEDFATSWLEDLQRRRRHFDALLYGEVEVRMENGAPAFSPRRGRPLPDMDEVLARNGADPYGCDPSAGTAGEPGLPWLDSRPIALKFYESTEEQLEHEHALAALRLLQSARGEDVPDEDIADLVRWVKVQQWLRDQLFLVFTGLVELGIENGEPVLHLVPEGVLEDIEDLDISGVVFEVGDELPGD